MIHGFPALVSQKTLTRKIELAISQFEKDNERPTANALRSFIHKTEQLLRSGKLPEAEGRRFIALTEEIISAVEAGETAPER